MALVLADQFQLTVISRDRICQRVLDTLTRLETKAQGGARAQLLKGEALRAMERYQEAIEPLREAVDKDASNMVGYLALGWCFKRLNKIESAIQTLEDALAGQHDEAIVHYNLACYWSLARNAGLALVHLSRALDLEPDYRDRVASEADSNQQ